ncbi:hypothetical protein DPEC_G00018100 [Dallia pectoralis]|uniref:Uncharacterized protein n=1 Tax=Dallia pectoralis TaxID=75939 RepID=A0ACC2HFM9_DALPE|nr:hypothetical protein DPEC_G00018100 [Dallia pectoralis]
MADEARDARSEQLAVCVRYVSEGEVKERFLALTEIKSFDAQSIANELQQQIQKNGVAEHKAKLYKFSTVYALLMFQALLSVTQGLHKLLQKVTLDMAEAFMGKDAVCDTLRSKRTDAFATDLYERTKAMCHTRMVSELGLLKGIQACSPKSENFLSESYLDELARHYSIDLKPEEVLVAKHFLARKTEAGCPPQDMLQTCFPL